MPCLDVTLPERDRKTREALAAALTEAFVQSTGFEGDIFSIRFCEYAPGEAATGGKLWEGEKDAPFLHLVLSCPRLRRSRKRAVVESMTEAFARATGRPDWKPVIHIAEHPYDNVGVGGKLLSDAYEECAKREFYYPLPKD